MTAINLTWNECPNCHGILDDERDGQFCRPCDKAHEKALVEDADYRDRFNRRLHSRRWS